MKSLSTVTVSRSVPEDLDQLEELASNLRWSWHKPTRDLFAAIDPELWEEVEHNPHALLRQVGAARLAQLAEDGPFREALAIEHADLMRYLQQNLWYQDTVGDGPEADADQARGDRDPVAAYFSMEFGITPSLPIYSGGLGVLAGDHLKSASDLGVPLIAVGMLYTYGYFAQSLTRDGRQEETYSVHDPHDLAVEPVCDANGEQVRVEIAFPEHPRVQIAVWVARVGRVPLLLLDTNIDGNDEEIRGLTDRLYGGNEEHRIRQELVLGVGGVRAVNAYCEATGTVAPPVAHLNEGHAGFLGLERIAERMAGGMGFAEALAEVRASSIFTTHTPVPAGIDRFDAQMVRRYLDADDSGNSRLFPGVPVEQALALGAEADYGVFNMAHMGLRVAARANGVAALHGVVSREMFASLYPGFEPPEVPIGHVTNGVHVPTWTRPAVLGYIHQATGGVDLARDDSWQVRESDPQALWQLRAQLRADLVEVTREALWNSWRHRGSHRAELGWVKHVLDPDTLTVGFARRVSTYKRLTLMLQDADRLRAILCNDERPVQFVIAGKAHPRDNAGKQFLQQMVRFADDAGIRDRFVFLPDYDLELASYLVSGSDIWLNNPVRPQEASGTSGMKAVMNGCMTLSISDGWWDEMDQDLGWTIPTVSSDDLGYRDSLEAGALYDLLQHEIAPMFYDRAPDGVPYEWIGRVERSMFELSPLVTSTRMVRDYTTALYRPAAAAADAMSGRAAEFVSWESRVREAWPQVRVVSAALDDKPLAEATLRAGEEFTVTAQVELGGLDAADVLVQAVFGRLDAAGELIDPQTVDLAPSGEGFAGRGIQDRPGQSGICVRVLPCHELLAAPAELGLVTYLQ